MSTPNPPAYVDTILVDCNRKGSEEYKVPSAENNPALFTCNQGSGIKLNPGDEVSVYSAFVNERGNDGNMEFKGQRPRGSKGYTLKRTNLYLSGYTETYEALSPARTPASSSFPPRNVGYGSPKTLYYNNDFGGYQQASFITQEEHFEVKDNEVNFQISYYKTANGSGYMMLPRRFDCPDPPQIYAAVYSENIYTAAGTQATANEPGGGGARTGLRPFLQVMDPYYWLYTAYNGNTLLNKITAAGATQGQLKQTNAVQSYPGRFETTIGDKLGRGTYNGTGCGEDCGAFGRTRTDPTIYSQVKSDWEFYELGASRSGTAEAQEGTGKLWKLKSDNSRFTIYVKQNTFYSKGRSNSIQGVSGDGVSPDMTDGDTIGGKAQAERFFDDAKDPAVLGEWLRYYEIKNVKVDVGYNTPDEVAEQFTDQLNRVGEPKIVKGEVDAESIKKLSTKVVSECFRPFHAVSHDTIGEEPYKAFMANAQAEDATTKQDVIKYQEAYHTIGVKRPDLWDAGRATYYDELLYPGNQRTSINTQQYRTNTRDFKTIHSSHAIAKAAGNAGTSVIVTKIPWTSINVMKYKAFFDAQIKYPELFDYDHNMVGTTKIITTIENSRFLHIDINGRGKAGQTLGSDNYTGSGLSYSSYPIWFDYDPTQKDIVYSDTLASGPKAYGIFQRVLTGADEYTIGFSAKIKLGDYLFPGGVAITQTSTIGYDLHFSAYGTAAMVLHNGYLNATYDGQTCLADYDNVSTTIASAAHAKNIYPWLRDVNLGANQIEMGYDAGKFYFHQLHTPEYIGNNFKAGGGADNPINPDAQDQVFKINKRLGADDFCPDMVPYRPTIITDKASVTSGVKLEIANFNPNLSPWEIYDAKSGIFIEDFGIEEDDWDECLWRFLGFSYGQFDLKDAPYDRQTRLADGVNVRGIGAVTTNANINPGDITTFNRNAYGAEQLTSQIPAINYPIYETNVESFEGGSVIPSLPAISQIQTSVKIIADTLPIKMKNPYYLIKSDIVSDTKYIGMGGNNQRKYQTGQVLPIVGVVNKENGFGDYYFQQFPDGEAFTITKPSTITSITTSIHDPDMSFARVDEGSAIIYRIKKNNTGNYNIGSEIIAKSTAKK